MTLGHDAFSDNQSNAVPEAKNTCTVVRRILIWIFVSRTAQEPEKTGICVRAFPCLKYTSCRIGLPDGTQYPTCQRCAPHALRHSGGNDHEAHENRALEHAYSTRSRTRAPWRSAANEQSKRRTKQ